MSYRWCGRPTPCRTEVRVTRPAVSSARSCWATPLRLAPIAVAMASGADGPWRRRCTRTARRNAEGAGPDRAGSDMRAKASKNHALLPSPGAGLVVDLGEADHEAVLAVLADAR